MEIPTRRRRLLSTVLALFLAIESVSAVAAVATVQRPGTEPGGAVSAHTPARVVAAPRVIDASSRGITPAIAVTAPGRVEATDPVRLGAVRTTPAAVRTRTIAVRAALALPKAKSSKRGSSGGPSGGGHSVDRKSTRLNSSHMSI